MTPQLTPPYNIGQDKCLTPGVRLPAKFCFVDFFYFYFGSLKWHPAQSDSLKGPLHLVLSLNPVWSAPPLDADSALLQWLSFFRGDKGGSCFGRHVRLSHHFPPHIWKWNWCFSPLWRTEGRHISESSFVATNQSPCFILFDVWLACKGNMTVLIRDAHRAILCGREYLMNVNELYE